MHAKAVPFYGCMHILCKYIRLREAINKIIMIFWSLRKCSRERERGRERGGGRGDGSGGEVEGGEEREGGRERERETLALAV